MTRPGMVIVGAGECGVRAAFALSEAGCPGSILIGEEAHNPYERPPLSKAMMTVALSGPKPIAEAYRYAEAGIRYLRGVSVTRIDRGAKKVFVSDGEAIGYEKLLLANGAMPRRLPTLSPGYRRIRYLRTLDDGLDLRRAFEPGKRLVIIGAGLIGMELAASARMRGLSVTVLEAQSRVMSRGVPSEIADILLDRHTREGVAIQTGVAIASIDDTPDGARVTLADGRVFEADLLVAAIGVVPVTALAEAAGLTVDDGILVDARLQTSDSAIFAAGDCCRFPIATYGGRAVRLESWRSAQQQGTRAALNMMGSQEPFTALPWFWSDQFDLTMQVAGLVDEGKQIVRRRLVGGGMVLFHLGGDGRLVAASGVAQGNAVARDIRLAEMMIARNAHPEPGVLADPDTGLKSLLMAV